MAVATSTAIIGGLVLAKGAYDTISAAKKQKERQAELDAYQRQELTNTYKDMQLSTIGSDAMREESSRNVATAMNTIGNAGTRAIIGGTPKLVAEQNNVNLNIQKELDDQVIKRNYAIAGDEAQIRGMQEQREYQDLAGLGNAIDTARQDKNMGINTMLNGVMSVGSSINGTIGGKSQAIAATGANIDGSMNSNDYSKFAPPLPKLSFAPLPKSSFTNNNQKFSKYSLPAPIDFMPKTTYRI